MTEGPEGEPLVKSIGAAMQFPFAPETGSPSSEGRLEYAANGEVVPIAGLTNPSTAATEYTPQKAPGMSAPRWDVAVDSLPAAATKVNPSLTMLFMTSPIGTKSRASRGVLAIVVTVSVHCVKAPGIVALGVESVPRTPSVLCTMFGKHSVGGSSARLMFTSVLEGLQFGRVDTWSSPYISERRSVPPWSPSTRISSGGAPVTGEAPGTIC